MNTTRHFHAMAHCCPVVFRCWCIKSPLKRAAGWRDDAMKVITQDGGQGDKGVGRLGANGCQGSPLVSDKHIVCLYPWRQTPSRRRGRGTGRGGGRQHWKTRSERFPFSPSFLPLGINKRMLCNSYLCSCSLWRPPASVKQHRMEPERKNSFTRHFQTLLLS